MPLLHEIPSRMFQTPGHQMVNRDFYFYHVTAISYMLHSRSQKLSFSSWLFKSREEKAGRHTILKYRLRISTDHFFIPGPVFTPMLAVCPASTLTIGEEGAPLNSTSTKVKIWLRNI
jgi:hypothetical protein